MQQRVDRNGHLRRSPRRPALSGTRLFSVCFILVAFVVTNPANANGAWIPTSAWTNAAYKPGELGSKWLSSHKHTNYGIFLLTKTSHSVQITALLHTVEVCRFDGRNGVASEACQWLELGMCHGRQLIDWSDRPVFATRLIGLLLVLVATFKVCSSGQLLLRAPSWLWLDCILSVLDERKIVWQFVRVHTIIYPALRSMEELVSGFVYDQTERQFHFIVGTIVLVFVIGAIGNAVGSYAGHLRIHGMDSSIAAAFGYISAVGVSQTAYTVFDRSVSWKTLFWTEAILLLIRSEVGPLIAVLVGGTLGRSFAEAQRRWLLDLLLQRWGRFWKGLFHSLG
mmetsp:Transcript_12502/g.21211  ORF Transcript_12502/g.21211 Transcript_12502/m.21211 type:complete len:338 (-) Transcript_12502:43-1056(-)